MGVEVGVTGVGDLDLVRGVRLLLRSRGCKVVIVVMVRGLVTPVFSLESRSRRGTLLSSFKRDRQEYFLPLPDRFSPSFLLVRE